MIRATESPVAGPGGGSPDDERTDVRTGDSLSREAAYEVLSNARRRHVIHYLLQEEGGISLRELSRQVAAWENDSDRSRVRPTDRVSDLRLYLEVVPENEIPWSVYYTGLGTVCGSATLLSWLGLFPFSEIGGYAWAGLTLLLVIVSGMVHVWTARQHELGTEGPPPELRD